MIKRFPAMAAAIAIAASLGAPFAQALESRVDAVTVYPRGADVTRVAPVSLAPGSNTVMLDGLPGDIDLGRVTAVVEDETVEVRSVRLDVREQREAFDEEVRRLEAAILEVRDAIEAIDDEIAAAELQLKFLEGLAQDYAARERSEAVAGQADIASWRQAMDSIGSGAGEAMERIRNARKSRREDEQELSVLERELEGKRGRRADSAVLMVSLASESSLETELRVSYFRSQAWWRSGYSAYLDSAASQLRLMHEAQVFQTTGEPWRNVQLTLSTGDPGGAMQAPDQDSEFLDLADAGAFATEQARRPERAFRRGAALEEVVLTGARVSPNRYAVIYEAGARADILNSTDEAQSVPLAEYRAGVSLVTRTTPRKSARAYVTAKFKHDSETPLFGGPMRVFVDGAFAGSTELPELLPGTEAVLPMGPDRQVEVIAIDQGGERGREGFLTSRNTELTDYLFEIVNRHSEATEVEVVDYYPVARDERIDVSVPDGATEPDEKDLDDRPGVVAWRKELAPGERWRISHQYEVSYPRDTRLTEQR